MCRTVNVLKEEFVLHISKTVATKNQPQIYSWSKQFNAKLTVRFTSISASQFFGFEIEQQKSIGYTKRIYSVARCSLASWKASIIEEHLPSVVGKKDKTNKWAREKRRSVPGQEDTLHHREVLHENIPVWFGAQVAHSVADAQLDGSFQGRRCGLTKSHNRTILFFNFKRRNENLCSKHFSENVCTLK